MILTRKLLTIALLTSGCGRLSPSGPGICPAMPELFSAAQIATDYWNALGTHLETPCTSGSISVTEQALGDSEGQQEGGLTHFGPGMPSIYVSEQVRLWGAADTPLSLSLAADVLAHEMGHAMGLSHVEDIDSVMYREVHFLPGAAEATDVGLAISLF